MALTIGTQLGSYEITALLGKGGMGEVYRARDTKLKREVAIKVLPEEFSRDSDRVVRFQREAEALAALNHQNIAGIYDLQQSEKTRYLVLELVEGDTLADIIDKRGALPLEEALNIAKQICEALEAAHEKGIVHRDLKPANVKVLPDGRVKVLDFGLAKALDTTPANPALSNSPTLSMAATNAGIILGTAAYMSPEQAKGKNVDRRTDIFAFGCVLYEMLTGRPAFDGEDVPDILSRILQREPDWTLLPPSVPPRIRELLRLCMEKNPKNRRRDAGDVRVDIEQEKSQPTAEQTETSGDLKQRSTGRARLFAERAIAVITGILLAGIGMWTVAHFSGPQTVQPVRFAIVSSLAEQLAVNATDRDIAISPDGSRIVYRSGGAGQIHLSVRALNQLDARPIAGITDAVRWPFISPDGHWIGFFTANGGELKKVSIDGGPPITLCRINGAPRGASWGPDGMIVFATGDPTTGLLSVPEGGGEPKILTKPDKASGEADHFYPFVLPGGRAVLFTITATNGQPIENSQIAVLDLKTGQKRTVIRGGSHAEYVESGHIVYAVAGTLRAVRFDSARLQVLSDPVPVTEQVTTFGSGSANFAISRNGTLVYQPGGAGGGGGPQRSLVWLNRQGKEDPISAPPRAYLQPRLSPDGTRVAVQIQDQENDIWIWDLMRQTLTRLTFDPGADQFPIWTPDSRRIIFTSSRNSSAGNLYWQSADNTGSVERLSTSPNLQRATSISPDGKQIVMIDQTPEGGNDIGLLTMDDKKSTSLLIHTTFREFNGDISPDGRWLAYESNESGYNEVYVRPFPNVDSGHWQISNSGGSRPLWARNGRELFYVNGENRLMAVPVQTGGQTFSRGNPTKLFDTPIFTSSPARTYDISPDGQRFLMIKDKSATEPSTPALDNMVVVLNWVEELKARTGTK
jgi:serine/threonine-protein kinase